MTKNLSSQTFCCFERWSQSELKTWDTQSSTSISRPITAEQLCVGKHKTTPSSSPTCNLPFSHTISTSPYPQLSTGDTSQAFPQWQTWLYFLIKHTEKKKKKKSDPISSFSLTESYCKKFPGTRCILWRSKPMISMVPKVAKLVQMMHSNLIQWQFKSLICKQNSDAGNPHFCTDFIGGYNWQTTYIYQH